jgi:hypothetical protein
MAFYLWLGLERSRWRARVAEKSRARKRRFVELHQADLGRPVFSQKIIRFSSISFDGFRCASRLTRGVRVVTDVERGIDERININFRLGGLGEDVSGSPFPGYVDLNHPTSDAAGGGRMISSRPIASSGFGLTFFL